MGPAQFNRHCLLNLIGLVKAAHKLHVRNRKAFTILSGQLFSQRLQGLFAIVRTIRRRLLVVADDFTDAPVGLEQLTIDLPGHIGSS